MEEACSLLAADFLDGTIKDREMLGLGALMDTQLRREDQRIQRDSMHLQMEMRREAAERLHEKRKGIDSGKEKRVQ